MARLFEPTKAQLAHWRKWVKSRPPAVRAVAERFDPWSLYRLKSSGHRVTIYSFSGDGTLTVNVTGQFNAVMFDRQVFGIAPDDLEPCEPPAPDEAVGTLMTPEDVDANRDALRVMVRPDLWVMNDDGTARRKH